MPRVYVEIVAGFEMENVHIEEGRQPLVERITLSYKGNEFSTIAGLEMMILREQEEEFAIEAQEAIEAARVEFETRVAAQCGYEFRTLSERFAKRR